VRKDVLKGLKIRISAFSSINNVVELGLRVYEAQMERKESGFNQMAFNKALLKVC
jgi:hypothetical protein